jgi:hypothetical protein
MSGYHPPTAKLKISDFGAIDKKGPLLAGLKGYHHALNKQNAKSISLFVPEA